MRVENTSVIAEGGRELPAPPARRLVGADGLPARPARRLEGVFYRIVVPAGVVANLVLGVVILAGFRPEIWSDWLQIGTGAFCCVVAGWLAAAMWSRSYWSRTQARQVALWRQIAGAFFAWLENARLPADSLAELKTSLDQVVPSKETH